MSKPKRLDQFSGVKFGPTGSKIAELVSYYPKADKLIITSGLRSTNDHHGGLYYGGSPTAAIDVSYNNKLGAWHSAEGRREMRDFAKWCEDQVPGYKNIVELIHTTPYNTDDGYYVKNGKKLGSYGYGPATNAAHANHIHLAMSAKQVDAALKKVKKSGGASSPAQSEGDKALWNFRINKIDPNSGTSPSMTAKNFLAYCHHYILDASRKVTTVINGQKDADAKMDRIEAKLDELLASSDDEDPDKDC